MLPARVNITDDGKKFDFTIGESILQLWQFGMEVTKLSALILVILAVACVEPFTIKTTAPTNMLVVEGVLSSQLKKHRVFLSRASQPNDNNSLPERGALVTISDQGGNIVSLTEKDAGIYETPEFSAQSDNTYTLHIQTADGRVYSSREVPFKNGPDIGEVYAKYVYNDAQQIKGIQVYADTEDPTNQNHFYRWNYIETYEVHAPFPSNWVWLGANNFDFRYDGIDTCYVTDTLRHTLIRSTKDLEQDKIIGQEVRFIPEISHILRYRYSILVQQFSLSSESYSYWENLRAMSEQQGSLSDVQPGSLFGNIVSLTDSRETVLGYFEVSKVSEKRIFFSALDFYKEGLKDPATLRSNCNDIAPILVPQQELGTLMPKYERTMLIWEVYGMAPYATFELLPKSCCDCRDQGPTERPSFF
jgi:hypothetical protein